MEFPKRPALPAPARSECYGRIPAMQYAGVY
jgi:hypothetical protein